MSAQDKQAGWTLEAIAQVVGAHRLWGDAQVNGVATDTRRRVGDGELFVALKGPYFDGHDFLAHAWRAGARAVMVQNASRAREVGFEAILEVPDTLVGLQQWAHAHRARAQCTVVGITGSNGKTALKQMLSSILAQSHTVHASPGSYNSQVGVALSLLKIKPEHEIALIECGISKPGEMHVLHHMVRPDLGVLTNIGPAHAQGLGSLTHTFEQKTQLFEGARTILWPSDDPVVARLAPHIAEAMTSTTHVWVSPTGSAGADVMAQGLSRTEVGWTWGVSGVEHPTFHVELDRVPLHEMHNAHMAIACALTLGACVEDIKVGLSGYEAAPMRVEIHTTPRRITLINDAYSADPVSASQAVAVLVEQAAGQRKIAIIGDMMDLGARSWEAHKTLGRLVAEAGVDVLCGVGQWASVLVEGACEAGLSHAHVFEDVHALGRHLDGLLQPDDVVLFKGSRAVGLERVARTLLESVGPTRLRVDLSAIGHNFHAIKARVGGHTKIMAVVKSSGYGNGAVRISKALVRQGVDALAVAYADEAIPLRDAGLRLPILVTNTLEHEVDKIIRYDLTALVYTHRVVECLSAAAVAEGRVASVHVEVNTGMNRAGVPSCDVLDFVNRMKQLPGVCLSGLMTHFSSADDHAQDDITLQELKQFEHARTSLVLAGIDPGVVHAANTSAGWRFKQARYDMIRVGLGLYGLSPSLDVAAVSTVTRAALRFETQVIFLQNVEPGAGVGYNQTWRAERSTRLATIAVGYNDGFSRAMSNGGQVLVRGVRCPVVGRVCMDVSVVDVSDVEGVQIGDEVVLFGQQHEETIEIEEMARRGQTISYEILCNISPRVRRIFTQEF